ncbi:MAG: fasciclin domain-containing protein [Gammaproteobacteria bacterium]|nr:fasciclin domain-containing protein [Gammaproteobacteria bacterium]
MTAYASAGAPQFIRVGGYGHSKAKPAKPDIVDTAVSAGSFNTLVEAVKAAGLVETLKSDGPFTVFAPTDEAFAKLPKGTLESLLADPDKLAQVLKYHVVPGKLDAKAVTSVSQLSTVQGSALSVGDIAIAQTDIMTSNGIIHVIDEVLIPQS